MVHIIYTAPAEAPSLASALTQSVRHHSRLADGEQPIPRQKQEPENRSQASYLDITSKKDEWGSNAPKSGSIVSMMRRPSLDDTVLTGTSRSTRVLDKSSLQAQRVESLNTRNISYRGMIGEHQCDNNTNYSSFGPRRFSQVADNSSLSSSFVNGRVLPDRYTTFTHASTIVAPPMHAFQSHYSSQVPDSSELKKTQKNSHRLNDSFLLFIVVVICFGLSLLCTIFFGEGKFGSVLTNMAYELKVTHMYGTTNLTDPNVQEIVSKSELVYPEWWEGQKGIPSMNAKGIQFSFPLENHTADVSQPRPPGRVDTPFFWFIPRSRGNVIRAIMSNCLHLVEASGYGTGSTQPFLIVQEREARKFVNVDLSTTEGLARAKDLKLASSGIPDVIISEDIHGILDIFDNQNRVIMFSVIRHPLDRAMSKYYADIASDPVVAGMTLQQYVRSGKGRLENNHLTRYLSGQYNGDLRIEHLDIAREFLRRKFVVGLARDLPTTAELFARAFGWLNATDTRGLESVNQCSRNIFHELSAKNQPSLEEGSEGWKMVMAQNWFDLKLYEYAEHLFQLQVNHLKLKSSSK